MFIIENPEGVPTTPPFGGRLTENGSGVRGLKLRVESLFCYMTDWNCYVLCKFKPSYTCQTTIIFETIKDYCLCHRNLFHYGVNTFSNMVNHFFPKGLKFCTFLII